MFEELRNTPQIEEISDSELNELSTTDPEKLMADAVLSTKQLKEKMDHWNRIAKRAREILIEKYTGGISDDDKIFYLEEIDKLLADRNFRKKAMEQWTMESDEEALATGLVIRAREMIEADRIVH